MFRQQFSERRIAMSKLKKYLRRPNMLVVASILLGLNMPILAADRAATNIMQEQNAKGQLERNIRRELITLSNYTVFDNLGFRLKDDNTVILSGQVVWASLRDDAKHAVEHVEGVKDIENNIEILPLSPSDYNIRRKEFYTIYDQVGFERYAIQAVPPIHIIVKNGNVTLEGVVDDEYDKNLAELAANNVPNVFHVTNNLQVEHVD
jgi:hyperosmotically inducible protein